jgi:hypothetical protein
MFQHFRDWLCTWKVATTLHFHNGCLPDKILLNTVAGKASRHTFTTESLRTLHPLTSQRTTGGTSHTSFRSKVKSKDAPVHSIKGNGGIDPPILKLGTIWGERPTSRPGLLYLRGKSIRFALNRTPSGTQSRCRRFGEEMSCACQDSKPRPSIPWPNH